MSMPGNAAHAYRDVAQSTRTARDVEYETFARITRDLKSSFGERARSFPAYAEALTRNRKLWRLLAADLRQPGNALPDALKAQILSLASFVDDHTSKALARKVSPATLVEVNIAIMQGLRGKGG